MQYIVISSFCRRFSLCSSQKFFLRSAFRRFKTSFRFVERVPFGLGALVFFSLFCVVSHYLWWLCVCLFFLFFALSCVVT